MKKIFILFVLGLSLFTCNAFGQWQPCNNGLSGGNVSHIAILNNKIFAMSSWGGIYVTSDNGLNWVLCSYCSGNYIVAHDSTLYFLDIHRIKVSTDYGLNWSTGTGELGGLYNSDYIAFSDNKIYIVNNGIKISTDSGAHCPNAGLKNNTIYSLLVKDSLLIASTKVGIGPNSLFNSISTDGGSNWHSILWSYPYRINSFAMLHDTLFAGSYGGGVFISTDTAKSWTQFNNGLSNSGLGVNCMTIKDSTLLLGTADGFYVLNKNTNTWTKKSKGLINKFIKDIQFNDSLIVLGTNDGVYFSFDSGENWLERNNGLYHKGINTLTVKDNYLFAGTFLGFYISSDEGNSWTEKNTGLKNLNINAFEVLGQNIYSATNHGIFISSDKGDNWYQRDTSLNSEYIFTINSSNGNLFAGTSNGLFGSIDSGKTWTNIGLPNTNIISVALNGNDIFCITDFIHYIDKTDSNYISLYRNDVFYSSDFGTSWNRISTPPYLYYSSITYKGGDTLLLGTYNSGLFMSTDYGNSFTEINLSHRYITSIASKGNYIFVSLGLYITQWAIYWDFAYTYFTGDFGKHWLKISLFDAEVFTNSFAFNNNYVFVGTVGNGVYRMKWNDLPSDVAESQSKNLSYIYPNPASNFIKINTKEPEFEVIIYDCLGQNVLQSKNIQNIDISNLNPGTYLYKVQSKEKTEVKKFIKIN